MDKAELRNSIHEYVYHRLLNADKEITFETALYTSGILKSMAHLKLINFLERKFDISIDMKTLRYGNFDNINKITEFVESKMNHIEASDS